MVSSVPVWQHRQRRSFVIISFCGVGNFNRLLNSVNFTRFQLSISDNFFTRKRMLIQQTEKMEGGLSDIEKRALRDIGEQSGAYYVIVLDHPSKLSNEEALLELKTTKQ
jgi:hypothetical protein